MSALPYFLTASLHFTLFIGCYWLILRRNTFFGLNRAYLLGSVVLSLTLPLLDGSAWWPEETRAAVGTVQLPTFRVGTPVAETGPTLEGGLWLLYGLGVGFRLVRLGGHLRAIRRLIGRGSLERRAGYVLVRLPDDGSPVSQTPSFSFGRYLVLNPADARTEPDALLRHEEAHIRQYHTADILFIELVRAAFWFNPVLWLYKRALQEVHEFLADRAASSWAIPESSSGERKPEYALQLVAYALNVPTTALTTPFVNVSTLKQRIVMLHKPASRRRALLGYAFVLPLAALLTLCTQPDRDASETQLPATIPPAATRQANIEGEIFTVVENQPEFPGGMAGLTEFMSKTMRYPAAAERAKVQGRVFASFIVTKDGEVTDVQILKGLGFGTDEEAVRVIKAMPRWKPGSQNGQPVNVRFHMPINFQLEDGALEAKFFEDLRNNFKTFKVNGRTVSFDEYVNAYKSIADGKHHLEERYNPGTKTASVILRSTQKLSPPPPPPVPANDASTLDDVSRFTINGKPVTKAELKTLSPNNIARVNVTKTKTERIIAVTTK